MNNVKFKPDQFIDDIELNMLETSIGDEGFRRLITLLTEEFGISKRIRSNGITNWLDFKISKTSSLVIGMKAGYGFTSDGNLIVNKSDISSAYTFTADGIFYIYIEYAQTTIEDGLVSVNSSGICTGVGTNFLTTFSPGKSIKLNGSLNTGSYEIISISDDENMVIDNTSLSNENDLHYEAFARVTPGVTMSERRWNYKDSFVLSVSTDSGLQTDTKFLLASVKIATGNIDILNDLRDKTWKLGSNKNIQTGQENSPYDWVIDKGIMFHTTTNLETSIVGSTMSLKAGIAYGKTQRISILSEVSNVLAYEDILGITDLSDLSNGTYYTFLKFKARESGENIEIIISEISVSDSLLNDSNTILLNSFIKSALSVVQTADRRNEFTPYVYSRRPLPVKKPLDLRIDSISPVLADLTAIPTAEKNKLSKFVLSKPSDNLARVTLKWGYDNLVGSGSLSTFTITNAPAGISANAWVDYGIWIPTTNKSYLITANTATSSSTIVLTVVETANRANAVLTGITATSTNPAIIHSFADSYSFDFIPVADNEVDPIRILRDRKESGSNNISESPVSQLVVKNLSIGMKYKFKVQTLGGNIKSDVSETPVGNDGTRITLPAITDDGVLALSADEFGFTISVSGWNDATHIEATYTLDGSAPDFTRIDQLKVAPTPSRTISIPTTKSTLVKVGIRGLQCGYQVTLVKTGEVTSGGGGLAPLGEKLIDTDFKFYAYTKTLGSTPVSSLLGADVSGSGEYVVTYTALKVAGRTWDANIGQKGIVNAIVKDSAGRLYRIIDHVNDTTTPASEGQVRLKGIDHTTAPSTGAAVLNSDTSVGRIIAIAKKLISGYQLTKGIIKIDFHVGLDIATPGKIRIGQSDAMINASQIVVNGSGVFENDLSSIIDINKDLVVDFVDTSLVSPNNAWSTEGHITVFGVKKITKINISRNIQYLSSESGTQNNA